MITNVLITAVSLVSGLIASYLFSRLVLSIPRSIHQESIKQAQEILEEAPQSFESPDSLRYWMAALASLSAVFSTLHYGGTWQTAWFILLAWALIVASTIDLKHKILPDLIILPLIWIGLLLNTASTFSSLQDAVIGAAVGYMFLFAISRGFALVRGRTGMGDGDLKLLAVIGAWGGWQILPLTLLIASVAGLIFALIYRWLATDETDTFPFGPALSFAGLASLLYGQSLPWMIIG